MPRKKRQNYIWLGIKGFFSIIWWIIGKIGSGLYYVATAIGYLFHRLAQLVTGKSSSASKPSEESSVKSADLEKLSPQEAQRHKKEMKTGEAEVSSWNDTHSNKSTKVHNIPPVYDELIVEHATSGEYESFKEILLNKSLIILVFGKRGSGKSTLGFRLMENINAANKRPCFVLGVKQALLPHWISEINTIEEVKNGGVVLVDEGAITFGSRESMSKKNKELGKLLAIARHKDLTLILITQNTGMIDKNVLSLTDIIMTKEGSLLQKQMERAVIKDFVEKADTHIKNVPAAERVKYVYVFSDEFEGLVQASQPNFWSATISKSRA